MTKYIFGEGAFKSMEDTTAFFCDANLESLEGQEEYPDAYDELVANGVDPQYVAAMMSGESKAQLLSDCPKCGGRIEIISEAPVHIICDTCDWGINEGICNGDCSTPCCGDCSTCPTEYECTKEEAALRPQH